MGAHKPWHADYPGRFADKFYHHLDHTAYSGSRPWNTAGLGRVLKRARRKIPYLPSVARIVRLRLAEGM
jgi:hypothetical protein